MGDGRRRPPLQGRHAGEDRERATRRHGVTASLAVRIAQLVEVSIDDLLDGRALPAQLCPHCGRPTDNFGDEQTVVEDRSREANRKVGDRNAF
jgi:hypothetical protein